MTDVPTQAAPQLQAPNDPASLARRFTLELANMNYTIAGRMMVENDPAKLLAELITIARNIQVKGL